MNKWGRLQTLKPTNEWVSKQTNKRAIEWANEWTTAPIRKWARGWNNELKWTMKQTNNQTNELVTNKGIQMTEMSKQVELTH